MHAMRLLPENKPELHLGDRYALDEEVNAYSALEEDALYDFHEKSIQVLGYVDSAEKTWIEL